MRYVGITLIVTLAILIMLPSAMNLGRRLKKYLKEKK